MLHVTIIFTCLTENSAHLISHLQSRSIFQVEYLNFMMFTFLSAALCGGDAATKKFWTELTCCLNPLWSVTSVVFCNWQ